MTGPVEVLEALLANAEKLAREAADGDSGEWFVGDKWNVYRAEDQTPEDNIESNRLVVYGNVRPQSEHIAANDPAAALRRIAKTREILAEHQPVPDSAYDAACRTCRTEEPGWEYGVPAQFPCRTVELLAEAWGWTGEQR